MENFTQYYGIDLAASLITFVAIYCIGKKQKVGFIIAIFGNLFWFALGLMTHSTGLLMSNIGLSLINLWAFYKWNKE